MREENIDPQVMRAENTLNIKEVLDWFDEGMEKMDRIKGIALGQKQCVNNAIALICFMLSERYFDLDLEKNKEKNSES